MDSGDETCEWFKIEVADVAGGTTTKVSVHPDFLVYMLLWTTAPGGDIAAWRLVADGEDLLPRQSMDDCGIKAGAVLQLLPVAEGGSPDRRGALMNRTDGSPGDTPEAKARRLASRQGSPVLEKPQMQYSPTRLGGLMKAGEKLELSSFMYVNRRAFAADPVWQEECGSLTGAQCKFETDGPVKVWFRQAELNSSRTSVLSLKVVPLFSFVARGERVYAPFATSKLWLKRVSISPDMVMGPCVVGKGNFQAPTLEAGDKMLVVHVMDGMYDAVQDHFEPTVPHDLYQAVNLSSKSFMSIMDVRRAKLAGARESRDAAEAVYFERGVQSGSLTGFKKGTAVEAAKSVERDSLYKVALEYAQKQVEIHIDMVKRVGTEFEKFQERSKAQGHEWFLNDTKAAELAAERTSNVCSTVDCNRPLGTQHCRVFEGHWHCQLHSGRLYAAQRKREADEAKQAAGKAADVAEQAAREAAAALASIESEV